MEAHALLREKNYQYLDVRSVAEFTAGHPEGAINAPLLHSGAGGMTPNHDFVAVVEANFPSSAMLVVGCRTGGRSQRAAMLLEAAGFENLVEMRGGWAGESDGLGRIVEPGWMAIGLPTSTAAAAGSSWDDLKAKR